MKLPVLNKLAQAPRSYFRADLYIQRVVDGEAPSVAWERVERASINAHNLKRVETGSEINGRMLLEAKGYIPIRCGGCLLPTNSQRRVWKGRYVRWWSAVKYDEAV